jgi:hypothetical protein
LSYPYSTVTKTVTGVTTAAFAANQVMGSGVQALTPVPYGGFIQAVQVNLNSTNANQVDVCFFNSSMPNTTFTNGSSIAISSADFASQGPVVNVTTWNYMGTAASNGNANGLGYAFPCDNTSTMYFAVVARGAVTLNSSLGLSVSVTFVS